MSRAFSRTATAPTTQSASTAAYLVEALGGPAIYADACSATSFVVREHQRRRRDDEMNEQAIACFDNEAMNNVG